MFLYLAFFIAITGFIGIIYRFIYRSYINSGLYVSSLYVSVPIALISLFLIHKYFKESYLLDIFSLNNKRFIVSAILLIIIFSSYSILELLSMNTPFILSIFAYNILFSVVFIYLCTCFVMYNFDF